MKLNKFQKLWIDTLKSGKTRKLKGKMNTLNQCMCCLGVAVKVCSLEKLPNRRVEVELDNEDLEDFILTAEAIGVYDCGRIKTEYVNKKWFKRIGPHESLVSLNDNTDMTHQEIGQFIDENRKAIFHDPSA